MGSGIDPRERKIKFTIKFKIKGSRTTKPVVRPLHSQNRRRCGFRRALAADRFSRNFFRGEGRPFSTKTLRATAR
jgi:hypothetical protein